MENLSSQAGKAHIHRALHLIGGLYHLPSLHIVCRTNHGHAGDHPHQGKVLTALVGRAVLANADPGVGSTNLYIQMRIANAVAHLLKGTTGSEHGKAGRKGYQPHGRQTGGHAHHIRLSNATVKVAIRIGFLKNAGLGCAGQVGVQHHQVIGAACSQFL